jgi:hypothetical protein
MCQPHYSLGRKWESVGVDALKYAEMFKTQNGVCAICKRPEETKTGRGAIKSLAVDHCHGANKVRGLLCANCNRALGLFRDDPELLRRAASYLDPSP